MDVEAGVAQVSRVLSTLNVDGWCRWASRVFASKRYSIAGRGAVVVRYSAGSISQKGLARCRGRRT